MAKMHDFWLLPKGLNAQAEQVLDERIAGWGSVSFSTESIDASQVLQHFLRCYSEDKAYLAIHVNDRMVLESFQCFLPVRTLREGYMPCWGLPLTSIAVIPHTELPDLANILLTLPPYAAWRRLRELCLRAHHENCNLLYRGRTPE